MEQKLEQKVNEEVIIGKSKELKEYAKINNLPYYTTQKEYLTSINKKTSLYKFTRKSTLGAFYRVGSSFTYDALILSLASNGLNDFFQELDPEKLLRITGLVIGINFLDYKFDITNKLDKAGEFVEKKISSFIKPDKIHY